MKKGHAAADMYLRLEITSVRTSSWNLRRVAEVLHVLRIVANIKYLMAMVKMVM